MWLEQRIPLKRSPFRQTMMILITFGEQERWQAIIALVVRGESSGTKFI